ncbi:amidohydrolase family protein [Microbacterium lacticum]
MSAANRIVTSNAIITMDDDAPRVEAIAVDSRSGKIVAVGALSDLRDAHPRAEVVDLGCDVVLPGFIDPHSHPLFSGMVCREPTHWIAPYVGYGTYDDVTALKIWADGSPWVGNIAATYRYLDNETVHAAGIPVGPTRESALNYTPAELDDLLDSFSDDDWQFAVHVNGDYALDVVLDSYQRELTRCALLGTDHRWRVKHVGGARKDQFERAAKLGVAVSMAPFQFLYWGDVLDGTLFPHRIGSQWQRFAGAVDAGASVSFHNDGSVSPPIPLRNIQAAVTRHTFSGEEHGPEQRMSLDDALRAHTVVAAQHIRRPDLGSITPEARSLALRRFGRRDARRVDHRIAHPAVRRVARRDARVVTCRPDRPARVGVIRNL